jgi:hypothetical protein
MTTATADIRQQVLEFAAAYPTPNVRAAIQYAEAGQICWQQVYDLFHRALGAGLAEVAR